MPEASKVCPLVRMRREYFARKRKEMGEEEETIVIPAIPCGPSGELEDENGE